MHQSIIKRFKIGFFELVFPRRVDINIDRPIVSFTFDDAPLSAAEVGGKMLENFGYRGTYYVAMNIMPLNNNRGFVNPGVARDLVQRGHEIGCHTFSHIGLRWKSFNQAKAECLLNTQHLSEAIPDYNVKSFSYPFGQVGIASKKALHGLYESMRTSDAGINNGPTDLSYLRAYSLYSCKIDRSKIMNALQETVNTNGWIIFFTHDIAEKASTWGVDIDDFSWVLESCSKLGIEALTVRDAINRIMHRR